MTRENKKAVPGMSGAAFLNDSGLYRYLIMVTLPNFCLKVG